MEPQSQHLFERAGLGQGPFRFLGLVVRRQIEVNEIMLVRTVQSQWE